MKKYTWEEMYEILLDYCITTEEALGVACAVGGCNEETMERVLFYFTGWKSFEGWLGELDEDEENDED